MEFGVSPFQMIVPQKFLKIWEAITGHNSGTSNQHTKLDYKTSNFNHNLVHELELESSSSIGNATNTRLSSDIDTESSESQDNSDNEVSITNIALKFSLHDTVLDPDLSSKVSLSEIPLHASLIALLNTPSANTGIQISLSSSNSTPPTIHSQVL
ncbi:hypothetical protein HK096_000644, partial [Nowakowskiella sp. JEL0078]